MDLPRPFHSLTRGARLLSRREIFGAGVRAAAGLAVASPLLDLLCRQAFAQAALPAGDRKSLILLWLDGGPSQLDTFDPKPGAPTQGPYQVLPTEISGWQMGEHLPRLATRAPRFSLIRTMTSKEGAHARARQLLHTGYLPLPSVSFPMLGSIVAHENGDLDADLPAFVQVGGMPSNGGYLGPSCAPFILDPTTRRIENLAYRHGVDAAHLERREELRSLLEEEFATGAAKSAASEEAVHRARARRLMDSKLIRAFETREESAAVRERFGKGNFGQGVLLARRLVEAGVAAVEVVLEGWDTHTDNFARTQPLCSELDAAFAALIDDLDERGLADRTLVVCMGEFGRTPRINSANGRDHWPQSYCVALAGCGVKPGVVVGTTDETGEHTISRPVSVADLYATLARLLAIRGEREFPTPSQRPVKLVDPAGVAVGELLA